MGHSVTIGGDRLGAGNKNKVYLHHYERSNHELSRLWRSTMASGTLVPFMTELALPGDTFDLDLDVEVLTHPTIGPLFGSYKVQLDVFQIPIRLYNAMLHMNMLGIGMNMSQVLIPQITLYGRALIQGQPLDNQQINSSCIFSYLGIRGVGYRVAGTEMGASRNFNAIPYLAYWDIYKNYYANKQEEQGAVVHQRLAQDYTLTGAAMHFCEPDPFTIDITPTPPTYAEVQSFPDTTITLAVSGTFEDFNPSHLKVYMRTNDGLGPIEFTTTADQLFTVWTVQAAIGQIIGSAPTNLLIPETPMTIEIGGIEITGEIPLDSEPQITFFPLENVDNMRMQILGNGTAQVTITDASDIPYSLPLTAGNVDTELRAQQFAQEGLALKTYQSDLFNNWIETEWIDGPDGISEITKIDTTGNSFTLDELNLNKKVYEMLSRISISGGTYDDWLDAVYTHERRRGAENPMYIGGLIKNLVFQEVISNTATPDQPLGTLAGRGRLGNKNKGGHVIAKIDEPSYIMGIISLTPHLDYSQGNKWDVNLKTLNDLHKPALDEIGYQDLITDQMAWWDTEIVTEDIMTYKSAGKQPAWINYMTAVNEVRGNFADQDAQMFMTLNRRYEPEYSAGATHITIKDLTTYIDPTKFNHIFADTRRDAQNFWVQVAINLHARRKMSAKVIPNL